MIEQNDLKLLMKALAFAAEKHKNQRRKNVEASPYINHPISLANILCNEAHVTDINVICGALLHDTVEDTETTEEELVAGFGNDAGRTAKDFRQALEGEFRGAFSQVVFAITDRSEKRRFLGPFRDVFAGDAL